MLLENLDCHSQHPKSTILVIQSTSLLRALRVLNLTFSDFPLLIYYIYPMLLNLDKASNVKYNSFLDYLNLLLDLRKPTGNWHIDQN